MSLYAEYRKRFPALIAALENARSHGRFAHSFLIHSPDEKVRREFTIVLQQIAGCKDSVDGRPDVECPFCRQLERGIYADCHTLTPVGKMYQIRVGEPGTPEPNTLRDLLDHLGYTAGNYRKFGVIEEADRMNSEAQNALLKTLEEPPRETTIILTTANPSSLLPTTRSRCQLLALPDNFCRFDHPWFDEVRQALFELCFTCANDVVKAESLTQTLLSVAAKLAGEAETAAKEKFADQISVAKNSGDTALVKRMEKRLENLSSGAYMQQRRKFLTLIGTFCQQVFMLSNGIPPAELPNPELFAGMKLPETISPQKGEKILQESDDLLNTLRFNVNDELALRTFALNIALE